MRKKKRQKAFTRDAVTLSVPQTGKRYYDIGKNASYKAARNGEIPTIRVGGRLRVPIVAMERRMSEVR